MPPILHLDWETRSACDLKTAGLAVYAEDPTTTIWLASYAFDEEEVFNWFPGEVCPKRVKDHISQGGEVWAHNAPFEIKICNTVGVKYGWPKLSPEQCVCTMAMAYAMAVPGSLEKAAAAVGLSNQKDMKGHRLMLKMSQPRRIEEDGKIIWWDDPELLRQLADYGRQDIVVERELGKRLLVLSEKERRVWNLDFKINERGVKVDLASINQATQIVALEKKRLDLEMRKVTQNQVATCSATAQLTQWIRFRGIKTEGIAKADVTTLLGTENLPQDVHMALILRQEAAKSSTAKLSKMSTMAGRDSRIRGILQYHGAGTGRWAGRGIQPQNFPKGKYDRKATEFIFESFLSDELLHASELLQLTYGSPMTVISNVLRSFIVAPPGKILGWADWKAIEARIVAWLAGEEKALNVFRSGEDPYVAAYSYTFGVPKEKVTRDQRQLGKILVLAFGFQGGKGAFHVMSKSIGVKFTDEVAEDSKNKWRIAHPNIVNLWHGLEKAAMRAVKRPGTVQEYRLIKYRMKGSFLWCQLPSGRVLCYPYPKIELVETPWGEKRDGLTYMAEDSISHKWERQKLYGGLLTENVTQAVARDILAEAMLNLDAEGFPIVMHVHDEIISELSHESELSKMKEIVERVPSWAHGLPIECELDSGVRYRK